MLVIYVDGHKTDDDDDDDDDNCDVIRRLTVTVTADL